jgi:GT2 family glycosyltransferase
VVIPTYERPELLAVALGSVLRHARPEEVVVVDQSEGAPLVDVPSGVTVLRMPAGFPGPRRRAGASWLATDLVLFLDDDCELLPAFAEDREALEGLAMREDVGLVSLPLRRMSRSEVDGPVAMCGGMLLRRRTYFAVGGHGSDYLDDVELALRVRWAGLRIVRHRRPVSTHHYGKPGGLRAISGVLPKGSAHLRLSTLDRTYSGRLVRDPRSWWGFREIKRG